MSSLRINKKPVNSVYYMFLILCCCRE